MQSLLRVVKEEEQQGQEFILVIGFPSFFLADSSPPLEEKRELVEKARVTLRFTDIIFDIKAAIITMPGKIHEALRHGVDQVFSDAIWKTTLSPYLIGSSSPTVNCDGQEKSQIYHGGLIMAQDPVPIMITSLY